MSEITHMHIAHVNIPITRLSVHETDHNAYYLDDVISSMTSLNYLNQLSYFTGTV